MKRYENESEEELILRICDLKDAIGTWQDVANVINELTGNNFSESTYRKKYSIFKRMLAANQSKFADSDSQLKEIRLATREYEKAKVKLQTEKLEYARWIREEARDELITDKIIDEIRNISPVQVPVLIPPIHNNTSYLLCITDPHYGIEFQVKDLFGNIINEYSPEIFEERMWQLFGRIIDLIKKESITELNIFELGDGIQGILRLNSQLMKLRYGIIESTVKYANFISIWLNELSNYVRIKFQMVEDSNHNQLRICGNQKNAFGEENMSKVMITIIEERLRDNQNIVILKNPTGMNYAQLSTYTVLGIHGEVKNFENSVNSFSRSYNTPIDYVVSGHIHHRKQEETGIDSEVLGVRSIIGVDPYGISLNKVSNAGASMFVFEQGMGRTCEYSIKLK